MDPVREGVTKSHLHCVLVIAVYGELGDEDPRMSYLLLSCFPIR